MKDGVISDFEITQAMLAYFIRRVHGRKHFIGPRVVIAIPSGITAVERRARYTISPNGPAPGGCIWSKNRWRPPSARACRSSNPRPA